MDMTDITLEQLRMLFNQQFGIFTIDSIVFGIGLTIGGIIGKFAKFHKISIKNSSRNESNNIQSTTKIFDISLIKHYHPPASEQNKQPSKNKDNKK